MLYEPALAAFGSVLMRRTRFVELALRAGLTDRAAISPADARWFADRFRDPVCARAATDTYRTFWLREIPAAARHPEQRRSTVTTRALFGTDDIAIHRSLAAEATAQADDYRLQLVPGCGHFIADERPAPVREALGRLVGHLDTG